MKLTTVFSLARRIVKAMHLSIEDPSVAVPISEVSARILHGNEDDAKLWVID